MYIAGVTGAHAQAQTVAEGLRISPAVIEDRVNPGDVYKFTLKVTNIADAPKTFYLAAQNISGLDDAGSPIFAKEGESTKYEMSTWVELPDSSITLGPNETKHIPFSVRVPADASPGAHFGGVFLDARAERQSSTGSGIGYNVGSLLSLRISGDVAEEARFREFSTKKLVYGTPDASFSLKVENLGNVLVRPHGVIEISDMFGKQVGDVRVNDSVAAVFPGETRTFSADWKYDGFALGRYQAVASLAYGEDAKKTITATTSFWVLPLKLLAIVIGSLLAAVLILYIGVRRYISNKLRDMGVTGSQTAHAKLYAKRYGSSNSRLAVVLFAVLLLVIAFLSILFFLFA